MEFNILRLFLTLRLEADMSEPYGLFALRGEFPDAFRRTEACSDVDCSNCALQSDCSYWLNFGQPLSSDPELLKRHQKPPLPFIFGIPVLPALSQRGTQLRLELILVGSAINHVNRYIEALKFTFSGRRKQRLPIATLIEITMVDYSGNQTEFMPGAAGASAGQLTLLDGSLLADLSFPPTDKLNIEILTPFRILQECRALRHLKFSAIFRALLRRISALSASYCNYELVADYRWLAEQSSSIVTVSDETEWVEWGHGCNGVIGRLIFTGKFEQFRLFLRLGEYLHVGKGASYGLGRFRMVTPDL